MKTAPHRRLSYLVPDVDLAEFEAMKGASRNLAPDAAVQEVAFLQRQYRTLWGNRMPAAPVHVNMILKTLREKRIPFVLTGAHGIAAWLRQPRNTQDIDILVKPGRNYTRAVNAVRALYPQLEIERHSWITKFRVPGERLSIVDVVCPLRPDNEETLANPIWVDDQNLGLRYRIPSLEEALANKYGAMLSPKRELGKRAQDMADFINMVSHSLDEGRQPIDMRRLRALGELVWPGGGGEEIIHLVEEVKAGRAIDLNSLG